MLWRYEIKMLFYSINILGTEYRIFKRKKDKDNRLSNKDGFCDHHAKEIVVLKCEENKDDIDQMRNLQDYEKKILRHEIIHAFLYESGLDINPHDIDQWARDEEMVDWMAIQFPKMYKIFAELDIL